MTLVEGQRVHNRYQIASLLGQGGMGAVYRAWDTILDVPVAIKENVMATPASARQFQREGKMMARLRHPNLPRVTDHFVTPDGAQYLVMDYVEGEDLRQMLRRVGPLHEAWVLAWIERVCDALSYLHSQQPPIIHRDIKPSNIKITPRGEVFLVDFGIAKVGDARFRTTTGAAGVTPGFSPPEQYGAGGTDARSDIYALGATLYALLTGRAPPDSVQRSIQEAALPPPQTLRPDLSPAVVSALGAALQTRPTNRPQTVAAFRALLRAEVAPRAPQVPEPRAELVPSAPQGPEPRAVPQEGPSVAPSVESLPSRHTESGLVVATRENLVWLLSQPEPPAKIWWEKAGMELCLVPAATFLIGSPEGRGRRNEHPQHSVHLDAYYIGRYPVTQTQYRRFVEEAGHRVPNETPAVLFKSCNWDRERQRPPDGNEQHPVVLVSWDDAAAFCEWAGLRLPTEAEWEKAASWDPPTESQRMYPWGDEWDGELCQSFFADGQTTPVGKYSPSGDSPYGCADMTGNVWEWVADWFAKDSYKHSPARNPTGPSKGNQRGVRGGAWDSGRKSQRCTHREKRYPDARFNTVGFRCAVGAEEAPRPPK